MGKAMAGDFMPRRRQRPQVAGVIEDGAVLGAAAKAAGRIISAAHAMAGQHRPACGPGVLGEVVESDAGHRPVPGQAPGPDFQCPRARLVAGFSDGFQAHSRLFSPKALRPGNGYRLKKYLARQGTM